MPGTVKTTSVLHNCIRTCVIPERKRVHAPESSYGKLNGFYARSATLDPVSATTAMWRALRDFHQLRSIQLHLNSTSLSKQAFDALCKYACIN